MLWKKSISASEKSRSTNAFWWRLPQHWSQGLGELSLTWGRRRSAFWPSPLNHTQRSGSFIIVTIISIPLTHKSCHKSSSISLCDNRHDQCSERVLQLQLLYSSLSFLTAQVLEWISIRETSYQCCIQVWDLDFQPLIPYRLPPRSIFHEGSYPQPCCCGILCVQNKAPPTHHWKPVGRRGQSPWGEENDGVRKGLCDVRSSPASLSQWMAVLCQAVQ